MRHESYKRLAERLDALPNGFPATEDGIELDLLAYLFSPEEAECASHLRLTPESPAQIAERIGGNAQDMRLLLKGMAKRGLITVQKRETELAYGLMPFMVGFYENQNVAMDEKFARLVEEYYQRSFKQNLAVEPAFHRVLPIGEAIAVDIEVQPFESAAAILKKAEAWGVIDCICRKQKALIGEACEHPIQSCMIFSSTPGAFDRSTIIKAQTLEESLQTLRNAAEVGLVHTIGNHQDHEGYICNCCTCSCGILRGVAELGISNVVARSAFAAQVNAELCIACENCLDYCQFNALTLVDGVIRVDRRRCVGCGQCVLHCTEAALSLVRRPDEEILPIPPTLHDWQIERAAQRGQNMADVS